MAVGEAEVGVASEGAVAVTETKDEMRVVQEDVETKDEMKVVQEDVGFIEEVVVDKDAVVREYGWIPQQTERTKYRRKA